MSPKTPFTSSIMMLVALLLVRATAVLASPIATLDDQPASTSISNSTCPTTVITYPTLVSGPTSTVYTYTSTVTSEYDCHGCEGLVVEQLGHVFPDIRISYTTTVTEYQPTIYIQAVCSSTPGNVQTESVTVSTTETAGYATVTVGSKTGDMGLHDLLLKTKSKTLSTLAAKRSGDFGGGHNPTRCINYQTGKPIPGCNTAREVDERQSPPGSIYPAACWNPITGLFDFTQPGCKITSRSEMDGDAVGAFHPLGFPNATKVKIEKECLDSCKASIEIDNPPYTVPKLLACDIPCVNLKTCGRETTCIAAKRAVEVDIQERQNSNANATENCTDVCNFIATDPNLPDSNGHPLSPADLAACVAQCVLFYDPGEDTQPPDGLSANHELEQRHAPQGVECPADGSECIEVDCPEDAAGRSRDEGQGDKRGVTPTFCYSTCISNFCEPTYEEIHLCRLDCGLGPQCVGDDCVAVKRAADIEVKYVARQDSLHGHPGEDQAEGCHFDGMALVCPS